MPASGGAGDQAGTIIVPPVFSVNGACRSPPAKPTPTVKMHTNEALVSAEIAFERLINGWVFGSQS
jgi:hypothetical protein